MFIYSVSNLKVKRVISANRLLDSPVGITIHRKCRDGWAVALKVKGKTIYRIGDKNVVSDSLHPVILPKGSTYSWKCIEPGECIIIEFESGGTENTFSSFEIKDNSIIINNFSKIEKSLNNKKEYYQIECNCYLYEILLFLLKSATKEYKDPKINNLLNPAIKYISENYFDSKITNDYLAKLCGISTVYFRKSFETLYGVSPIKYLNDFRIKKAKDILRSDFQSIEHVAFSVGYSSIYHFSKMFKKHTGNSPTEYANGINV